MPIGPGPVSTSRPCRGVRARWASAKAASCSLFRYGGWEIRALRKTIQPVRVYWQKVIHAVQFFWQARSRLGDSEGLYDRVQVPAGRRLRDAWPPTPASARDVHAVI